MSLLDDPTITDSYRKQITMDNSFCLVEVIEMDNLQFLTLKEQFCRVADCVIYVDTFERGGELEEMQEAVQLCQKTKDLDDPRDFALLICRSKSDKNLPFNDKTKILKWSHFYDIPIISCSAKTRTQVLFLFETACRKAFLKSERLKVHLTD